MENQIRSLSSRNGDILFFTAIPDQGAMEETMRDYPDQYGWQGDNEESLKANPSQEYTDWLTARGKEETEKYTAYYATVVPQGYTLRDVFETQVFDKFLEKCYEEESGWLYELNTIQPETIGDNVEVVVLDFNEEYDNYEELQLGIITKDMIA